jgi:hypothetical protein
MVSVLYGQDQIISRKGVVINCKVIKTESNLVYFDSQIDGVVVRRCIAKSEISKIRYGIGNEVKFANVDTMKTDLSDTVSTYSGVVQTQPESFKRKYNYYFVLGFALSSYRGSGLYASEELSRRYRFFPVTVGAGVSASMSKFLSIRAGLEYVPKGERYQRQFAWKFGERVVYKTNYLELPVCLDFSPSELKRTTGDSFYLTGGIAPSFLLTSKRIYEDEDYKGTQDFKNTNRIDICTILGIGYKMNENFLFEFRYEGGSKNIYNNASSSWYDEVYILYNRSLCFTAKYMF